MATMIATILTKLDYVLASREQRIDAQRRLRYASAVYGAEAGPVLQAKLRDARRRKSRRSIRIALANLGRADLTALVNGEPISTS